MSTRYPLFPEATEDHPPLPFPQTPSNPPVGTPRGQDGEDASRRPLLFQPLTIKGLTLKNRITVSPMCMYSASNGYMSMWHTAHLGQFAINGAGLIIVEATGVLPNGRITPYCTGIWEDGQTERMKEIVQFAHSQNAAIGIQLAHAGRKASTLPPFLYRKGTRETVSPTNHPGGWDDVVGPSPIPFNDRHVVPSEMSQTQIKEYIGAFVAAAKRAEAAGFDLIEIHGAHGYLISSFLSPLSNQRTDQYGGSFENRVRFVVEILEAVHQVWPKTKPVFLRISCHEWVPNGWNVEDSVRLGKVLHERKLIDLLDCSSGGNAAAQQIPANIWGFQVPFAHQVRNSVPGLRTGAVGRITEPWQAEKVLRDGSADLILLGQQLLREPNWPLRAAKELGYSMFWAPQYMRAYL